MLHRLSPADCPGHLCSGFYILLIKQALRGGRLVAAGIAREDVYLVVQLGDMASIGGIFNHWLLTLNNMSLFSPKAPMQAVAGNHAQYF